MGLPKGLSTRIENKNVIYRLYQTDIVTVDLLNECITLRNGNWFTRHTKKCINLALEPFGLKLIQVKNEWYITGQGRTVSFWDGIELNIDKAAL